MQMTHWARLLKRSDNNSLHSRLIVHPTDVTKYKYHKEHYTLDELVDICNDESVIIFHSRDYKLLCNELSVCNDEIIETIMGFMPLCTDYNMYTTSTKVGDPISIEHILNGWLTI